jgi:hypothetical protein
VPNVLKPRDNVTTEQLDVNEHIVVKCEALFGLLDEDICGKNLSHCDIGWDVRSVERDSTTKEFPVKIEDNSRLRVYAVKTQ